MAFTCPACLMAGSLKITGLIELPPDDRSDEVALQIVSCEGNGCEFKGIAKYEESRRGATESFHHTGYRAEKEQLATLELLISACPDPTNHRCDCDSHQQLAKNPNDLGAESKESFPMTIS